MTTGANLIMPYSLQSYMQESLTDEQANMVSKYYADDYYVINGRPSLHKFFHRSDILEKQLDSYWEQNPIQILTVLA